MGDKEFEFLPCLRGGAAGGGVYEGYNTAVYRQASAWRLCLLGLLGLCGLFYWFAAGVCLLSVIFLCLQPLEFCKAIYWHEWDE